MTKAGAVAAISLVLLTCASTVLPAATPNTAAGSQCRPGERVVYECRVGEKLASVCLGANSIHYRFGSAAGPELDVSSAADWANIHIGGNRSQGGLNQDHIRFSSRDTHYVIHAGETGSLNENPGRRISGVAILKGSSADDEVASMDCAAGVPFDFDAFEAIPGAAPKGWDGSEADGGPFDVIY
jgi:hypothetical protein